MMVNDPWMMDDPTLAARLIAISGWHEPPHFGEDGDVADALRAASQRITNLCERNAALALQSDEWEGKYAIVSEVNEKLRVDVDRLTKERNEALKALHKPLPITKATHTCKHHGDNCQEHNLHCQWPACAEVRKIGENEE